MSRSPESNKLVDEIRSRLAKLPIANTPSIRNIRRDVSQQIKHLHSDIVLETAHLLLEKESSATRFLAYELVCHHKQAFQSLRIEDVLELGTGLDSWSAVDCFAMYLSGPVWLDGRISDDVILSWVASQDMWWRRAALVSTVALSRRGLLQDVRRVVDMCTRLTTDRADLIVKALSWALRELSKKHPEHAKGFIAQHRKTLAARIIREVESKLTTGRKALPK